MIRNTHNKFELIYHLDRLSILQLHSPKKSLILRCRQKILRQRYQKRTVLTHFKCIRRRGTPMLIQVNKLVTNPVVGTSLHTIPCNGKSKTLVKENGAEGKSLSTIHLNLTATNSLCSGY
jgi:hypothetical protein